MTRRAALLLATLAACRRNRTLESWVPGDAVALAGVRLEALKDTPLVERNPFPQVQELLVSWDGASALFIARGEISAGSPGGFQTVAPGIAVAGKVRRPGPAPAALLERAHAVPAGPQIWAVTLGSVPLPFARGNWDRLLRSLEDITFTAEVRQDVFASATASAADEPSARQIGDILRGLLTLAGISAEVESRGRTLTAKAAIPPAKLKALLPIGLL